MKKGWIIIYVFVLITTANAELTGGCYKFKIAVLKWNTQFINSDERYQRERQKKFFIKQLFFSHHVCISRITGWWRNWE